MDISTYGFTAAVAEAFTPYQEQGLTLARITTQRGHQYVMMAEPGELVGQVSGRFEFQATRQDFPAVGDWVAVLPQPGATAVIHAVLPRTSSFVRKVAGGVTEAQVVAANVETVFLVSGLGVGRGFNLRSIERYLTLAWDSGAAPVIVLNKRDLCDDIDAALNEADKTARGVPVHAVSATQGQGLQALQAYLTPGQTVALLGPSGVGKSSLINALLGYQKQSVQSIREDDGRGRHTTVARELIPLPGGALLIDTPGMRELQLWVDEEHLDRAFPDIEELAQGCRFRDCTHQHEPDCAVRSAVAAGELEPGRFENYLGMKRELRHLERRRSDKARRDDETKWKKIAEFSRRFNRESPKRQQ